MSGHDTDPTLDTIKSWVDDPDSAPDQEVLDEIVDRLAAERLAARQRAFEDGKRIKALAAVMFKRGVTNQAQLARRLHITPVTMGEALSEHGIPPVRKIKRAEQAGITAAESSHGGDDHDLDPPKE